MEDNTGVAKQTPKQYLNNPTIIKKFEDILGDKNKATAFRTSVLQVVASNEMLAKADPSTIYHAAITAATMELPINNNLGFAYIIPFYNNKKKTTEAQFMIGYKGFLQLAQRSGQFKTISASPIYEGQLISQNPLTGFEFDFSVKPQGKPIGYASYFSLLNGFEKTMYSTVEELDKHAKKFSQTYKKGFGLWKDDFESMAQKTVLKLLISKFAPLSIEMQKATEVDQSVINDPEGNDISYPDNTTIDITQEEKQSDRMLKLIENAKTLKELETYEKDLKTEEEKTAFIDRGNQFLNAE